MGIMRYIRSIAFVSGIIFSGCMDSGGIFELKGKAFDENTKVIIPNRKIIVQSLVKNDDKFISSYAGEFSTDSSGSFAYFLKKVKNVYLYDFCVVGDSAYAFSNNKLGLNELNRYGMFLSFYLRKLSDLTLKIDRKSKTSFCDTLFVSW
jgi:hypothetical protein